MDDGDDIYMWLWTGIIIRPHNTVNKGRFYQLKLFRNKDYPEKPPGVGFDSRINVTCVNHETGVVEPKKSSMLANWQREYMMEMILTQLKKEMSASTTITYIGTSESIREDALLIELLNRNNNTVSRQDFKKMGYAHGLIAY